MLSLGHQSHGLGMTKTISYLRERVWWPGLGQDAKRFVEDCYPCSVAIFRNDLQPIVSRPLPDGPMKEVSVDFKGPVEGKNGFYYRIVIDNYSCYLEVANVYDAKFSTLKPVLEEVGSRWGYPEKVTHDGAPPYSSHKWQNI